MATSGARKAWQTRRVRQAAVDRRVEKIMESGAPAVNNQLASRAMLVTLNLSSWTARKIDERITEEVRAQHNAQPNAGRYNKALLAKGALADVSGALIRAGRLHRDRTMPWLDSGARILPAVAYERYVSEIQRTKEEFDKAVDAFVEAYPGLIEKAREDLNGMFNETDYPSIGEIRDSFGFAVRVLPMPDAADFRASVGQGQIDQIKAEIEKTTRAALEGAMLDAWRRIIETCERVVEKLKAFKPATDTDKAQNGFRDSLVEHVRDLVGLLPAFNLTADAKMTEITERLDRELCRHSVDVLKADPKLREATAKAAEAILADVSDYLA